MRNLPSILVMHILLHSRIASQNVIACTELFMYINITHVHNHYYIAGLLARTLFMSSLVDMSALYSFADSTTVYHKL